MREDNFDCLIQTMRVLVLSIPMLKRAKVRPRVFCTGYTAHKTPQSKHSLAHFSPSSELPLGQLGSPPTSSPKQPASLTHSSPARDSAQALSRSRISALSYQRPALGFLAASPWRQPPFARRNRIDRRGTVCRGTWDCGKIRSQRLFIV